jgi:COP9 signalosome complex subunit 8
MLNLFASVWERRYENVYSRCEAVLNLAQQGDSLHTEVTGVFTSLVTAFIESFRQRTISLLSKAYSTIPFAIAQAYLGLPTEELLSLASEKGWHFDAATHVMTPARVACKISSSAIPSTFAMFNTVTDNVARLEA